MEGQEVFKFAVKVMDSATIEALNRCGLKPEDIDMLIPHQANTRIIEAARKRLKLSNDKIYINLDKYGNTSAASVAIALDEAYRKGLIKKRRCHTNCRFWCRFDLGIKCYKMEQVRGEKYV